MTTPISRAAVLEILHTPAASDTFPDMIRRVEALEGCGSSPPFHFDRYINGVLMAEGVTIERQSNMSSAMQEAARIASRGPSGEAPVLVYFGAALEPVAQPETPTPGQFTTMCLAPEDAIAAENQRLRDRERVLREYYDAVEAFDDKPWKDDVDVMAARVRAAKTCVRAALATDAEKAGAA